VKSISIKDAKRRFGDCARKAAELTPGDLSRVASATENAARHPERGAEFSKGVLGYVVGKASEALHAERRSQQIGRAGTVTEGPNERIGK